MVFVELEEPDVGAHPLFFATAGPVLLNEHTPSLPALLREPVGLVARLQKGLEAGLGKNESSGRLRHGVK